MTLHSFWTKLFTFLFVLNLGVVAIAATPLAVNTNASTVPKGAFNVLLKAIGDRQNIKQDMAEKKIALAFEENLNFPSLVEISRLELEIEAENQNLEAINTQYLSVREENAQLVFLESISLKQEQISSLMAEKEDYLETYNTRKDRQQTSLRQLRQDLDDLDEDLQKQEQLIAQQFSASFGQFLLIVLVILFLLLFKFISVRIVRQLTVHFSEKRQTVLGRMTKLIFNLLIFLVLLGTISSQLVSLLPFLALLGTGIAFAVRDALSSFLGWFLIGGSTGYKKGQVVQLGDYYGRVHEVTPFLTLVKDIKGDHETGEITSFPNKVIFEQPISHFSKYQGFVHKDLQFLISEDTDLEEAKSTLKDTIARHLIEERKATKKSLNHLIKTMNLTDDDVEPLVWVESNNNGLGLRSRFLVRLEKASYTKAQIEEDFIKQIQLSDTINFHYTDSGRNQSNQKIKSTADRDQDHFH